MLLFEADSLHIKYEEDFETFWKLFIILIVILIHLSG